ncbi:MAG: beta-lactamase regulator AmpE [Shewanella sp.]
MALFSLLMAILVERLKWLPPAWQWDRLLQAYQASLFGDKAALTPITMALALTLPALLVYGLMWLVAGMFWGIFSLGLWVAVAVICFTHLKQREIFKKYMQAACRGDVQACYHFAAELDCSECLAAVSEADLGAKVGQSVAWINYRYYGAVALFLILLGPVGAVFYCTVRFYAEENASKSLGLPLVSPLMALLDWLPSRLFALGFALSGQLSEGLGVWRRHAFSLSSSARELITQTVRSAQQLPEAPLSEGAVSQGAVSEGAVSKGAVSKGAASDAPLSEDPLSEIVKAPVCVQSTLALLVLSKRNFILIVTVLSLLTIFGVVN